MTTLVGILGGDKNLKRVFNRILLPVIICFFFLSLVPNAVAQSPTEQAEAREAALGGREAAEREGRAAAARAAAAAIPVIGASGPLTAAQQAAIDAATGYTPASDAAARAAMLAENMGSTPDGVLGFFHTYVLTGIGWVVGMAGSAFDYAITNYIIGFGSLYITGTGETINELWSTVRDIFNLTFIFGLVYIGFKMILDSSDSSARKMLVSLIGAALLVNFSLFITKFVVDFSNIAAAQIFNAFEGTGSGPLSITNGFMKMMGIQSLIGVEYSAGGSFAYIIGMLLIFAVLAYVFLAGAIMIIIRFVVLNIYMVFSPFMFLGWVFPALQSYSRDYWSGFLRQAFFAPAFLFMLYLSYRVASTFPTQRDLGHMFNPNGSSVVEAPALIPYFALVIVFLCASMVVAKKMGAHGASAAINIGNKLRGGAQVFMGAASAGLLARGGRTIIGGSASALTQNKAFRKIAANTGFVGKGMMLGAAKVADSSFDARKVGGVGKKLGVGEGKKGGFTTRLKESKESDSKFNELLGKVTKEDYLKNDPWLKKKRLEIAKLENQMRGTTDDAVREQIQSKFDNAQKELKEAEDAFGPEQQYANQITYLKNKERWQGFYKKSAGKYAVAAVGIGATLITGGIAAGAIGALAYAGATKGVRGHSQSDINAIVKEYGRKGEAKKENEDEVRAAKAVAKALKAAGEAQEEPKKDAH